MIKILFLLMKLNYAFTIGYLTLDDLTVYDTPNQPLLFVDFNFTMEFYNFLSIEGSTNIELYQETFLRKYNPFQIDFSIKCYTTLFIEYAFLEIGFFHHCIHPIVTFCDEYPEIIYEGGKEYIYITISNKEN